MARASGKARREGSERKTGPSNAFKTVPPRGPGKRSPVQTGADYGESSLVSDEEAWTSA